jgi:Uma2 family endonuclease
MAETAPKGMTADEFIAWTMEQPETEHYELVAGEVVAMAPERVAHARTKGRVFRRLVEAIESAGLPCEVYPDGMAVQVDAATVYEPDALVRCGDPLDDEATKLFDPLIIVEVLSPSTRGVDAGNKLADYFRLPSLRHYLLIRTDRRTIVHHERDAAGDIATRIIADGPVRLDPPGIELAGVFG